MYLPESKPSVEAVGTDASESEVSSQVKSEVPVHGGGDARRRLLCLAGALVTEQTCAALHARCAP